MCWCDYIFYSNCHRVPEIGGVQPTNEWMAAGATRTFPVPTGIPACCSRYWPKAVLHALIPCQAARSIPNTCQHRKTNRPQQPSGQRPARVDFFFHFVLGSLLCNTFYWPFLPLPFVTSFVKFLVRTSVEHLMRDSYVKTSISLFSYGMIPRPHDPILCRVVSLEKKRHKIELA